MLPVSTPATEEHPRKTLLFSTAKTGKTTLLSGLPNCLIVDIDNGSEYIEGIKYNAIKRAKETNQTPHNILKSLGTVIHTENVKKGDYVYDFVAIDTVTALEKIASSLAVQMYKNSNVGKNYKGIDVVGDLPSGGGYYWLRKAFAALHGYFDGLSRYGLIYLGHVKQSAILRDGKDLSATDLDLTGKIKQILCSEVDAIGLLYRNKDDSNKLMCSFKTNTLDLVTGSRIPALRDKEFIINELKGDKFEFHWDIIFPQIKTKSINKEKGVTNEQTV